MKQYQTTIILGLTFILLFLILVSSSTMKPQSTIPNDCNIYRTHPPSTSTFNDNLFPYPRHVFSSRLIDLTYLQNINEHLIHGEGWNRTQRLLKKCLTNGIKLFCSADQGLFLAPMTFIAKWFISYGCSCVDIVTGGSSPDPDQVWASIGIHTDIAQNFDNLIIVQTEQMTSPGWSAGLKPRFLKCQSSLNCVIWEFSESNIRHAIDNYATHLPSIILPTMIRRETVPPTTKPINERPYGYVFFGYGNGRRDDMTRKLESELKLTRYKEGGAQATGFAESKLCVSVHFYGADSGLELHRLAQHAHLGCLPLYETPGDTSSMALLEEEQGVMKFADYGSYIQVAQVIKECIDKEPKVMIEQQEYVRQWWSYELEAFDRVLLAFFGDDQGSVRK